LSEILATNFGNFVAIDLVNFSQSSVSFWLIDLTADGLVLTYTK